MTRLRVRQPKNQMRSTSMKRTTPSGGLTRTSSPRAKPRKTRTLLRKKRRLPKS